jgi:hypothetical protein
VLRELSVVAPHGSNRQVSRHSKCRTRMWAVWSVRFGAALGGCVCSQGDKLKKVVARSMQKPPGTRCAEHKNLPGQQRR